MKKWLMILGMGILVASCSDGSKEALEQAYQFMSEKNYREVANFVLVDSVAAMSDTEKDTFAALMGETFKDAPAYTAFEVVKCEKDSVEKEVRNYEVKAFFADGDSCVEEGQMVKDANDEWKVRVYKYEPVDQMIDPFGAPHGYYRVVQEPIYMLLPNTQKAVAKILSDRGLAEFQWRYANSDLGLYHTDNKYDLLEKSAAQGYAPAQADVGFRYLCSKFSKRKRQYGADLLKKAVAQKYHPAYVWLSRLSETGKIIPLLKEAAEFGLPEAQYYIAEAYMKGEGVEKDEEKGAEWYAKAAAQKNSDFARYANQELATYYYKKKDYAKAIELYSKGVDEMGNPNSSISLAKMYEKGEGVEVNLSKAYDLYKAVLDSGYTGIYEAVAGERRLRKYKKG